MTPRTEFGRLLAEFVFHRKAFRLWDKSAEDPSSGWDPVGSIRLHEKMALATDLLEDAIESFTPAELDVLGDTAERIRVGREQGQPYDPEARIRELEETQEIMDALWESLSAICSKVAVALKGEPPPLTHWGYHDLPEVAQAVRERAEAAEAENARLREAVLWFSGAADYKPARPEKVAERLEGYERVQAAIGRDEAAELALPPPCAEHVDWAVVYRCNACGHETTPMAQREVGA